MLQEEYLLHRQVHPSWMQDGVPSSQTFRPTAKDAGKLSIYDGNQINAEASFAHHTIQQKLESAGVVSVSMSEVEAAGLTAEIDGKPFAEHGYIDFTMLTASNHRAKSAELKKKAWKRGWSYQP